MRFDIVPDRLDARLRGAGPRQVDPRAGGGGQRGLCRDDDLAGLDGVVVQGARQGTRPPPGRRCRGGASGARPQDGQATRRSASRRSVPPRRPSGPGRRPARPASCGASWRAAWAAGPTVETPGGRRRGPACTTPRSRSPAARAVPARARAAVALRSTSTTCRSSARSGRSPPHPAGTGRSHRHPLFCAVREHGLAVRSAPSSGSCVCRGVRRVRCPGTPARRRWMRTRSALRRTPWRTAIPSAS